MADCNILYVKIVPKLDFSACQNIKPVKFKVNFIISLIILGNSGIFMYIKYAMHIYIFVHTMLFIYIHTYRCIKLVYKKHNICIKLVYPGVMQNKGTVSWIKITWKQGIH